MGACQGAPSTHATQYNYTKYKYSAIIFIYNAINNSTELILQNYIWSDL